MLFSKYFSFKKYVWLFNNRDLCNKNHLEYNVKISPVIQDICSPLSQFGITMFTYSRIFNGGKRLYMCSDPIWVERYITQEFQDEIDHFAHYVPLDGVQYALWEGFKRDKVFDGLYNHNMGNGFSIYEKHKEYVDFFDFASHKDNNQMNNLYLNNIDLMLRFIEYFKEKISLIVDFEDKKNVLIPKKFTSFDEIPRCENISLKKDSIFFNQSLDENKILYKNEIFNLTHRELETLRLLSEGKTVKEISRSLRISHRTLDSHLQRVKIKFGAATKGDLIMFYHKNFKVT
jgi:DNA-binding CsgD family transcriptional regulator